MWDWPGIAESGFSCGKSGSLSPHRKVGYLTSGNISRRWLRTKKLRRKRHCASYLANILIAGSAPLFKDPWPRRAFTRSGPKMFVDSQTVTPDSYEPFAQSAARMTISDFGIDKAPLYQTGFFNNGKLAAVSGYRPWNDHVGDPCVLTHPEWRGRGYGAAVMSETVGLALTDGKLLLCQTLESNIPAVKIAQRLGYARYAQHVAVRLKASAPGL